VRVCWLHLRGPTVRECAGPELSQQQSTGVLRFASMVLGCRCHPLPDTRHSQAVSFAAGDQSAAYAISIGPHPSLLKWEAEASVALYTRARARTAALINLFSRAANTSCSPKAALNTAYIIYAVLHSLH
jgi:hypothetical protein